jgi:transposase
MGHLSAVVVAPRSHALAAGPIASTSVTAPPCSQPYKRHGTTTLFAALNVLDGTVIGRNMQRHRHQEFIRFLNEIERAVPAGKIVHVILDNYAAHKHPKVRVWLERHPRWTFHFTPTSSSWLNAVEGFFATLTRRQLKRGVFRSIADLQAAINRFVAEHNQTPRPFSWRADPDAIIAARNRGFQALESIHSHVRGFKYEAQVFLACCTSFFSMAAAGPSRRHDHETTVDHALMRGLITAGPLMRRGAASV